MRLIARLIGEAEDEFSEYEDLLKLDAEQEKTLFNRPVKLSPEEAYKEAKELFSREHFEDRVPEYLERVIATDPKWSLKYSRNLLVDRFPLGEPAIATDADYAYQYANDVLCVGAFVPDNKRFPMGEPAIAKDAATSFYYAREIIGGRFPLGEPAIAKDPETAYKYSSEILKKGDFVPGSKRFPAGERAIATDPHWSYFYAIYAVGGRFPRGEPVIFADKSYADFYKTEFNIP